MGLELATAMIAVHADGSSLPRDFRSVQNDTGGFLDNLVGMVSGKMAVMIATLGAGFTAIGSLMKAGAFEQTVIAFETMIGSAEETKQTLADLTEFAAKTPFEMPEIESAARGLIQFGERGDELMETLNMLGNAASGTSTPFGFLALVFNQVRGVGKLLTQDFRQLSTRGILSLQDIADYYGVATDAAQEMLSKGEVSFEGLKGIFKKLSGEGGRFFNLMERQSRSMLGMWSTFQDALGITSRILGEALLPTAKAFVENGIEMVEVVRSWVEENKDQVSGYIETTVLIGKYVIALTAAAVAIKAVNIAIVAYTAVTRSAASASAILQALSGPAGWAKLAIGVGVATATIYQINQILDDVSDSTEAAGDGVESVTKKLDNLSAAAEGAGSAVSNIAWGDASGLLGWAESVFGSDEAMQARIDQAKTKVEDLTKTVKREMEGLQNATGDENIEKRIEALRYWMSELENAKEDVKALTVLVDEFGSAREVMSFLSGSKAMSVTPEEELEATRRKLQALVQLGQMSQEEMDSAFAEYEKESPLHDSVEAAESLQEKLEGIRMSLKGMTSDEIEAARELEKFSGMAGVSEEDIQRYKQLQKQIAETNKESERRDTAKSLTERFRTDVEKSQEELTKLQDTWQLGLISEGTYKRGLERYKKQLQPESLLGAGTIGFADFGNQIQNAILQRNDPNKITAEESKKQTTLLGTIDENLKRLSAKPPAPATLG